MSLSIAFTRPRKANPKEVKFEPFEPSPDTICPITQDPIASSQLEFLGDQVFSPAHPSRTGTRLACKHEFTAMCLVYHWARNGNVLCPVCRAGPKGAHLNLRKLPAHFRTDMCRRIKAEKRTDHAEHILENEEAARQFDYGHWFATFMEENEVCCEVRGRNLNGFVVHMRAALLNDTCVFTGRCDALMLRGFPEVMMMGVLKNMYYCKTLLPASTWTHIDSASAQHDLSDNRSSVRYHVAVEGNIATITMEMPSFLFQVYAEQHDSVYAPISIEWYSLHD